MSEHFTHEVFLSHSAKDKKVVSSAPLSASTGERVRVRCRQFSEWKDGLKVWFDKWVLKPGDQASSLRGSRRESAQTSERPKESMSGLTSAATTEEKAEEGLERSRVLVLCMSTNAFGSDWA